MYVGSRKLARRQAGCRDLRLAHVCQTWGWKFMPANRSRHPTKLITALGSRAHEGGCPCFARVSGVCHIYQHFHFLFLPFFFPLFFSPKRARWKRVRVRRSRSIREPGRVSPASFCTSINSSETSVKYLDNERERAFFEVPVEGSRPRTCEISKLKISIVMVET